MKKKRMMGWMFGIPLIVVLLIIIIRIRDVEKDTITRAAAYKAAALSVWTVEECGQKSQESSLFSASSQNQWYVKYMDALYQEGWISRDLTPATEETAEGALTYEEAAYLAGQVSDQLEDQVGMTKKNRQSPYPSKSWWKLYEEICGELEVWEEDGKVREETLTICGTFEDTGEKTPWRAYTSEGSRGFEGLGLSAYRDREIRVLSSGREILRVIEKVSDSVVYKNIWIIDAKEDNINGYLGSITRDLPIKSKLKDPEEMSGQVADVYLTDGEVKKIVLKKERISGKVLQVSDEFIEVEGYGEIPLTEDFRVYRLYGELRRQNLSDVVVGYDAQEFVVEDKKLCAALTMRPFDAEKIRVLIMDNGFRSIYHDSVTLEFKVPGEMITGDKTEAFNAGDVVTFRSGDNRLSGDRVILRPSDESAGIRIPTINRGAGTPEYPGQIEVKQESGGLVIVNEVYLEEYLKRVVPSEMPASYELEALKTQAVCARTYAWRQIMANGYKDHGAHVDDSTQYQVYNNTETYNSTDTAVNETYGKMVMYDNEVAEIYYFSTSCGHTTDGTLWGADQSKYPYLKGVAVREEGGTLDLTNNEDFAQYIKSVPDGFESDIGLYRWKTSLTSRQLERKVTGLGNITKVAMKERSTGGIGKVLVVQGTAGSKEIRGEWQIRSTLGNQDLVIEQQNGNTITGWDSLPSAFVSIECGSPDGDGVTTFTIYGGGYGHGVGMSQNGAQGMAKAGKDYREILEFFFPGTRIAEIEDVS